MSPLFNSNNRLMGDDHQSSLSIIALIGSDKPHSTFSVDAGDTDLDADVPLFTRGERTSSSREGGGGREFDGINCCSNRSKPIPDAGVTPVVEAPPPLIPTFLSRTNRESPNAEDEPGHLTPAQHHRCIGGVGAVQGRERRQLPSSRRTTVRPGGRLVSSPRPPPRRQFSQHRKSRH